jgi:AcrR family transcriptional regulator
MGGYGPADMVRTPWGNADELRKRKLRPGPGGSREESARNQRERLFAAMVSSTASRGYRETSVSDLLDLAGVSRATFYVHFRDKADCFRATVEAIYEAAIEIIRRPLEVQGPSERDAEEAFNNLLRSTVDQPAAAKTALVEAYAAGSPGLEPIDHALEKASQITLRAMQQLPGHAGTPPELARAVIGGLHRLLYRHVYRDDQAGLVDKFPELWRWMIGYLPADALAPGRRHRATAEQPPYSGRDPYERILRSFATTVARRGFPSTTIGHIAADASISLGTFYQHFENKEDALLAAIDLSGEQLTAAALPAARRAPDWPRALRRALEAVCGFLAAEPAFARLRAVEVYAAGPEAIEYRDRSWQRIVEEIVPAEVREGRDGGPGSLTMEASNGAVYALVYEKVRRSELDELSRLPPLLTYIMLTPFLGAEEARVVAQGD